MYSTKSTIKTQLYSLTCTCNIVTNSKVPLNKHLLLNTMKHRLIRTIDARIRKILFLEMATHWAPAKNGYQRYSSCVRGEQKEEEEAASFCSIQLVKWNIIDPLSEINTTTRTVLYLDFVFLITLFQVLCDVGEC